jgi:hypothetical protein
MRVERTRLIPFTNLIIFWLEELSFFVPFHACAIRTCSCFLIPVFCFLRPFNLEARWRISLLRAIIVNCPLALIELRSAGNQLRIADALLSTCFASPQGVKLSGTQHAILFWEVKSTYSSVIEIEDRCALDLIKESESFGFVSIIFNFHLSASIL